MMSACCGRIPTNLPADGRVLITVPAFRFLWFGHDEFLEHRRRYTRGMVD
jgi:hypothetical protein